MACNRPSKLFPFILSMLLLGCLTQAGSLGGYPTDYYEQGIMARASALGGAARTVAGDSSALFYNSALLGLLTQQDSVFASAKLLGDTNYTFASLGLPIFGGMFAINAGMLNTPGIEKHLSALTPTLLPDGYFQVGSYYGVLGYGQLLAPSFYGGIAIRYEQRQVDQLSDQVYSADLGLLWRSPRWIWSVNLKNIYVMKTSDTQDQYPMMIDVGAQWKPAKWMCIMVDATRLGTSTPHYFSGVEADWLMRWRAGMNDKEYAVGCGLIFDPVRLDYAYVVSPEEVQHRVTFGLSWRDDL